MFAAFSPALFAEFLAWDDQVVLGSHSHYHAFTLDNLRWMATATLNGHWMPVTWVSYTIDHALWGMNPRGYHLTNLVLHAVNAGLVYLLAVRLIVMGHGASAASVREHIAAAFAAAFFALHPLRVESVAWVTERRDVLSAAFLLGAALMYLRAVKRGGPGLRSWGAYVAAIVLLALSLLSKAWGMSFFVIALAMDWYPLRRLPFSPFRWLSRDALPMLVEKIPFALLGTVALVMAAHAQDAVMSSKTLADWPIASRVVQAIYGLFFYIWKTVVPTNLSPLYEIPVPLNPFEPRFIAAGVFVVLAAIALWVWRKRFPGMVAAAGVYCVVLAPVLGVNQSGEQLVADRYSYLACIGLMIVGAACGLSLFERLGAARAEKRATSPVFVPLAAGLLVGACVLLTFSQTTIWRTTRTLWEHAISVTPTHTVRTHYAVYLLNTGKPKEAVAQLEVATADYAGDGRAWFVLGNEYRAAGRFADAERAFKGAIEHLPIRYTAHVNLGAMYLKQMDRPADAIAQFKAAVADVESGGRRPLSALPYLALGDALRRTGDVEGARAAFTKALDFDETRVQAEADLRTLPK